MNIDGILKIRFMPQYYVGHEDDIREIDVESIKEIARLYSLNNSVWSGVGYNSQIDWSELTKIVEESYDVNGRFFTEIEGNAYKAMASLNTSEGLFAPLKLPVKVFVNDIDNVEKDILAFRKLLMDIFLVANFSAPGVLDLFNARLNLNGEGYDLKLSSFYFAHSANLQFEKSGFFPVDLPVSQVKHWLDALDIGLKMTSEHSIERSIFSLLHICRMEVDISMVPWVFHALEAIYGTNAGRGFNDIKEKVFFLLSVPVDKQKALSIKLRELNDLRSSFVHGGYKVAHPLDDETEDRVFNLINFGVALIICSIQQLIAKDWIGLTVTEAYGGVLHGHS